jgi:hypothetical protein
LSVGAQAAKSFAQNRVCVAKFDAPRVKKKATVSEVLGKVGRPPPRRVPQHRVIAGVLRLLQNKACLKCFRSPCRCARAHCAGRCMPAAVIGNAAGRTASGHRGTPAA